MSERERDSEVIDVDNDITAPGAPDHLVDLLWELLTVITHSLTLGQTSLQSQDVSIVSETKSRL
jgi:hypothetical protein